MNTKIIEAEIKEYIQINSGYDDHRKYLGMSKIAGCPRKAFDEYKQGTKPDEITYRMCFAGYEQERSIMKMLEHFHFATSIHREIVAPFDSRLLGHIDGETMDGGLVEIKSVSRTKFDKIIQGNKPLWEHYVQTQLYMHFGGYKGAFIVYRCRETYEHRVIFVSYNQQRAEQFEVKAKDILAAIDSDHRPECECNKCSQ